MVNVYLCGVHPLDFKGPERLSKVLKRYDPDSILLDFDEREAGVIIKNHQILAGSLENPNQTQRYLDEIVKGLVIPDNSPLRINRETLAGYMSTYGYPAWVVYEYSKDATDLAQVRLVGNQSIRPEDIMEHLFETDLTLAQLLSQTPQELQHGVDASYMQRHTEIPKIINPTKIRDHSEIIATEVIGLHGDRRLVIIHTGYIFGPSPNIYDHLTGRGNALKVERFKLIDADNF